MRTGASIQALGSSGHPDLGPVDGESGLRLARSGVVSWVNGAPRSTRHTYSCVRSGPRLTFIGMLWQRDNASASLAGVARDAESLASRWEVAV
jgi:hypothetical protein